MNVVAEKHLSRAEGFLTRGDEYYGKAADEIIAARDADLMLTWEMVAKRLDHSESWCRRIVRVRTKVIAGEQAGEEIIPDWHERGSHATTAEIEKGIGTVLSKAPLEQIEHIVEALPAKAVAKLAQAALGKEGVTREMAKSADAAASVTRASGRIREEMEHDTRTRNRPGKGSPRAVIGFLVEVLGPLNGAKRLLGDSYEAAAGYDMSKDETEAIHELLDECITIIDWYRSYLDSGNQSFEDELSKLLSDD